MKAPRKLAWLWLSSLLVVGGRANAAAYRVFGYVIDGGTSQSLTNVQVDFLYDPLASAADALPVLVSTNTDSNGEFSFDGLPGELSGELQVLTLPTGYSVPMKEQVRASALTPTNQVIFRAGPAATLLGSIVITNGTAALTNFTVEVNATETNVAADGTFVIPELPAYQQTARLIYQVGYYFDERVISLPAMTPGQTNSTQIPWYQPMRNLSASGVLQDVNGYVLTSARFRLLGLTTGVFVGMMTDANGNYAIYDLPPDSYMVRAFVGRWGVQQATLSASDSILCVGNGGGSTVGDGIPDGWRQWYFGSATTNNSLSCALCDPDSDGVSNLLEYQRGTDPTNLASANITLYADSLVGSNGYDGYRPAVMGGHGPKLNIQPAIAAAIRGDSVQIAAGTYSETTINPQSKTVTLKPVGTVTIP